MRIFQRIKAQRQAQRERAAHEAAIIQLITSMHTAGSITWNFDRVSSYVGKTRCNKVIRIQMRPQSSVRCMDIVDPAGSERIMMGSRAATNLLQLVIREVHPNIDAQQILSAA